MIFYIISYYHSSKHRARFFMDDCKTPSRKLALSFLYSHIMFVERLKFDALS